MVRLLILVCSLHVHADGACHRIDPMYAAMPPHSRPPPNALQTPAKRMPNSQPKTWEKNPKYVGSISHHGPDGARSSVTGRPPPGARSPYRIAPCIACLPCMPSAHARNIMPRARRPAERMLRRWSRLLDDAVLRASALEAR